MRAQDCRRTGPGRYVDIGLSETGYKIIEVYEVYYVPQYDTQR